MRSLLSWLEKAIGTAADRRRRITTAVRTSRMTTRPAAVAAAATVVVELDVGALSAPLFVLVGLLVMVEVVVVVERVLVIVLVVLVAVVEDETVVGTGTLQPTGGAAVRMTPYSLRHTHESLIRLAGSWHIMSQNWTSGTSK